MADQGAGGYRHRAVSFAAAALRDGSYSAHAQQELTLTPNLTPNPNPNPNTNPSPYH